MDRCSGILMPIFSLPGKYGAGSFGKESYDFADYLAAAGQKIWQVLPLVQTGYGNSPYSSVSSESFNPYFISPELLKEEGLLKASELKFSVSDKKYIDYGELYAVRYPLLRKAFSRFDRNDKAFRAYLRSKKSLDYALFMAIKYASGQKHFYEWDLPLKRREPAAMKKFAADYKEEVLFWQFVQFVAEKQWFALKKYANSKGVAIFGDMPLYVALDSVDVWKNPEIFKLDENFSPKKVAGVPPDYFSESGQLWGNPVYDYEALEKDGFSWWVNRLKKALSVFDYVRIDHFRGLDRYYEVDADRADAKVGEWIDVPSEGLFAAINSSVKSDRIVAEDLGIIDDGVRKLLKRVGYPGMKILSFAFNGDKDNLYLPERIEENYVCYTGTHDNDTFRGLIEKSSEWDYGNLVRGVNGSLEKMNVSGNTDTTENIIEAVIELGFASAAKAFIMPMQDILKLGTDYRINEPGTVKEQNWAVKFGKSDFKKSTALKLKRLTEKYKRY